MEVIIHAYVLNGDRAEVYELFTVYVIMHWTPPMSHKARPLSAWDRHNIARVLIRDNGPVKVLLVPSEEQRQTPTMTLWGAYSRGRVDPM